MQPLRLAPFAPSRSGAHKLDDALDAVRQEARAAKAQYANDPPVEFRGSDPVFESRFERTKQVAPGQDKSFLGRTRKLFRESFITSNQLKGKDVVFEGGGQKLNRTEFFAPAIDRRRIANALHRNVLDEVQGDLQNVLATVKNPKQYEVFVRKALADEAVEAWARNDEALANIERVRTAEQLLQEAHATGDKAAIRAAAETASEAKAAQRAGPQYEHRELGETRQQAIADQAALDKLLETSPGLRSAYDRHIKVIRAARDELVARGLISPNSREFYFPHYIIDFLNNDRPKNLPRGAGLSKTTSQNVRARVGGREWSRDYISVMGTYLTRTKEMLMRHDLMDEMAHMYHVTHRPMKSVLERPAGGLSDLELYKADSRAIPRGYVAYRTSSGWSRPRPTSLAERVFGEMTDNALPDIVQEFGASPHVFDDVMGEWRFNEVLKRNREPRASAAVDDFQPQMGSEVVIPKELADELTIMAKGDIETSPLNRKIEGFTRLFKTVAINARPVQYNVRNALGDMQRAMAQFGPHNMLKPALWKEAAMDILNAAKKNYSHDWIDAHRYGLMSSGRTAVETVKIKDLDHFRRLTGAGPGLETAKGWLKAVGPIPAQMREDMFRMYLYKLNKQQWAQGGENALLLGVVDPDYISGLLKSDEPARAWAAIARKSLIDFGDFTQSEEVLRNGLIPFYSWMKGNLSFWFKDLPTATGRSLARTLGANAKPTDVATLAGAATVAGLVATARAWNYQNDDFRKAAETLPDNFQQQTTIILPDYKHWQTTGELKPLTIGEGRDQRVATMSVPDAMDDALDASGMAALAPDLIALYQGRLPMSEFVQRRKEDALHGPVNYVVRGLGPITSVSNIVAGLTGAGGLRTYPDIFEAKQVPPEKAFQTAIGGMALTGLPGSEQATELFDSQVASPVTKTFDIREQLGYRDVRPMQMPTYINELIYKFNKAEAEMNDLMGRLVNISSGLSEPQLTKEQREARKQTMIRIYKQKGAELRRLGQRIRDVRRTMRVNNEPQPVLPAGPQGQEGTPGPR